MYSDDLSQIRGGLVNYIGAMINASPYESDAAKKHSVVAIILEEALKLCQDSNGEYEMFPIKPILRASSNILSSRAKILEQYNLANDVRVKYENVSSNLDEIVSKIKE